MAFQTGAGGDGITKYLASNIELQTSKKQDKNIAMIRAPFIRKIDYRQSGSTKPAKKELSIGLQRKRRHFYFVLFISFSFIFFIFIFWDGYHS